MNNNPVTTPITNPIKTRKDMKKEQNKKEEQRKLTGIDLQIAEAQEEVKKAEKVFKEYPNREAFRVLSEAREELKKLQEEKAKAEGRYNPTAYMPWRTTVRSRIWMDTIKKRIQKLGLKIENEAPGKITLRGKQCGVLLQDLMEIGLTEDEDFEITTRQMTLEGAREFYRKENERMLKEAAEKEARDKANIEKWRKMRENWEAAPEEEKERVRKADGKQHNVRFYHEMGTRHSEYTVRI